MNTPHLDKLDALLDNDKLPINDKERIGHAIEKYHEWIQAMIDTEGEQSTIINCLVSALSEYKQFIDLNTIFDGVLTDPDEGSVLNGGYF